MAKKQLTMPKTFDDEDEFLEYEDDDSSTTEEDGVGDTNGFLDLLDSQLEGAKPLPLAKQEHFTQLIFQGTTQFDAYKIAFGSKGNKSTLTTQAKKLLKKDHVKDRLNFLNGKLNNMDYPTERKDAIALCSSIMRSRNKPTMLRLQALDRLAKMMHWFDAPPASAVDKRPDPAWFVEYMKKASASHPTQE